MEPNEEFLHTIVHKSHFVLRHEPNDREIRLLNMRPKEWTYNFIMSVSIRLLGELYKRKVTLVTIECEYCMLDTHHRSKVCQLVNTKRGDIEICHRDNAQ